MKRPLAAVGSVLLMGGLLAGVGATSAAAAPDPLSPSAHRAALKASAADAFAIKATAKDADGTTHVRYSRTHRGLRVLGGDFILHGTKRGASRQASVGLTAPLTLSTAPMRTAATAKATAKAHFTGTVGKVGAPELVVDATTGTGTLAYETVVEGFGKDGQTPSKLHVVTDANTGTVLSSWDTVETAHRQQRLLRRRVDHHDPGLHHQLQPQGRRARQRHHLRHEQQDLGHLHAVHRRGQHLGHRRHLEPAVGRGGRPLRRRQDVRLLQHAFGRKGIFNNGTGVPSRVHYGNAYVNAFWDGSSMTYGDGTGNARPLVSLDVAGHEMSHGVTERTAGLIYSGESGGLNEATSDIFGTMVEFYAANATDPGDYLSRRKDQHQRQRHAAALHVQPDAGRQGHGCWSSTTKNVDVHYSSGVGNHFFFNLAEGSGATAYGTSPLCGSATAVTGIGRSKAAAIWYRALTTYFTSSTHTTRPARRATPSPRRPICTASAAPSTRPCRRPGPRST